jgi:CRP-like cAMP-binding protein
MGEVVEDLGEQREIAEIERLIKESKERFRKGTREAENFVTIHEIERMWGELQSETSNIYTEMISELLRTVDESEIIRKKKENI